MIKLAHLAFAALALLERIVPKGTIFAEIGRRRARRTKLELGWWRTRRAGETSARGRLVLVVALLDLRIPHLNYVTYWWPSLLSSYS